MSLYYKSPTLKKVTVTDFKRGIDSVTGESAASPLNAAKCYNFDFSSGELKKGYGLKSVPYFEGIALKGVWLYRRYDRLPGKWDNKLMGFSAGGEVFYCNISGDGQTFLLEGAETEGETWALNYRLYGDDVVIIMSKKGMYVWNGTDSPYSVPGAPDITSAALHYERMFVTVGGEKNAVWFSDDLDPTNWDVSLSGGGFIEMSDERGALNKIISFLGYLYVFRDYGITKITAYADQSDFAVSNLFVSSGKIYPGSVCVCGDSVLFLSEDGLYSFGGITAQKILPEIAGIFGESENCVSTFGGGKYYLSFRHSGEDKVGCENGGCKNSGLLVFDVNTGKYSIMRGGDIRSITYADDGGIKVAAADGEGKLGEIERCGSLFGHPLEKLWSMPKTDFKSISVKRLKELYIFSEHDCKITLKTDRANKTVDIKGSDEVRRIRVSLSGRRIGMDISASGTESKISRPTLVYEEG